MENDDILSDDFHQKKNKFFDQGKKKYVLLQNILATKNGHPRA